MPQKKKDIFAQRKRDVLSKTDKSYKKSWDRKIIGLCEKINSLENYYTTSSCSGRIVLMINQDKKEKDLFLRVYHNKINFSELKKALNNLLSSETREIDFSEQTSLSSSPDKKVKALINSNAEHCDEIQCETNKIIRAKRDNIKFKLNQDQRSFIISNLKIKFKLEPCILHVVCKTLEDAQKLLNKAKLSGWKKSGIISFGKNIVLELNSTEKLEFPIIQNKKILVDDEFLKIVVE